jgi:hypothetical protein
MSRYQPDPNDSTKQVPKTTVATQSSHIATFDTDALAKVDNPVKGTMTFSVASGRIWIYNGTSWKEYAAASSE